MGNRGASQVILILPSPDLSKHASVKIPVTPKPANSGIAPEDDNEIDMAEDGHQILKEFVPRLGEMSRQPVRWGRNLPPRKLESEELMPSTTL